MALQRASQDLLVETVKRLSQARSIGDVATVVRSAARQLVRADGATFVMQQHGHCFYVDEDAIGPLWKGRSFPLETCVSGWAMLNKTQAIIPDIYDDERVPQEAYRPTFVKSLVMTPVRKEDPIAAIGTYWAHNYHATDEEVETLQTLADTTSVALANVALYNELEARVKERTEHLELINAELELFASRVSHDLKGPLRGIQRLALVQDSFAPEQLHRILTLVSKEAERLANLTDALMKLSKFTSVELARDEVDISAISNSVLAGLRAESRERDVNGHVQDGLCVVGDGTLLRALFQNLLSNAWKYSSKRPKAQIEVGACDRTADTVTIFVRDNGVGFDMNKSAELFRPFSRLDSAREFEGTGVGLATVRSIANRHGGDIWAESKLGEGSTFFVKLPTL